MAENLPYTVKNSDGQQNCVRCNKTIKATSLQLGEITQSEKQDAKIPKWYDIDCFFKKVRPASENLFNHFAILHNTEKNQIRKRIANGNAKGKKGVKRAAVNVSPVPSELPSIKDFSVQYSQSGKNVCSGCIEPIAKGKIETKKVVKATGSADISVWYHLECFTKHSSKLGWNGPSTNLPGFQKLNKKDREKLKKKMGSKEENNNEPPNKKLKTGSLDDVNAIIEQNITKQNKQIHDWKENLEKNLKPQELIAILQANNQFVPKENAEILMHTADILYFGALQPCDKCKDGKFIFGNSSYKCTGNYSDFTKCNNELKVPIRFAVKIPQQIQNTHHFLKQNFNVEIRAIKIIPDNLLMNSDKPLFDMEFAITGNFGKKSKEIRSTIQKLGGTVAPLFLSKEKTAAVISKVEEVQKDEKDMLPLMKVAKQLGIQVVPEDYLDAVKTADPFMLIKEKNLSTWDCIDPSKRIARNGVIVSKSDSFYDETPSKVQKWKNGVAVDEECDLENTHVYFGLAQNSAMLFIASMTLVDIGQNKNSYCRLSLIESDDKNSYWICEKQGRISTKIGDTKQKLYKNVNSAVEAFKERYQELTGNNFGEREFVKKPEKFQLMDIVYDKRTQVLNHLVESQLNKSVYQVMKLICDEKAMKQTMLRFNIDTDQMPMGKISKSQINVAAKALKQLSRIVESDFVRLESDFIEASNRFYTMIPHKFIQKRPPIINTTEMIASKMEMLERLREIEFTYSLLNDTDNMQNPLDHLYHKLNADISPLDRNSIEYGQIMTYVEQTHDPDYHEDKIEVLDVLEVVRHGEESRFEPFKNFKNRTLLWHGSSLTNFVGILSTGLKLAPPDVIIHGKAFGNGIYFADAVAKSSHYCNTSEENEALLLLCEVALGDIYEAYDFNSCLMGPPNGKHSVKGIGSGYSRSKITRADGVLVPYGPVVFGDEYETDLDFNEYIVYDEAQVKIRYLVKVKITSFDDCDDDHGSCCSCSACATDIDVCSSGEDTIIEISD
ncbi:poly [ADP-ribose] polymerase-like [Sitodiplosis mosellana]|uniref:poly [ADP-ribose] polymerase-like n=1 Tax=Sitodiplosis mosellana TaxID=263140 RepID=UPI002443EB9C|nr:poly [ADP-ribose] polymerase-like [Sitodiplosis mosellana]